MNPHVRWEPVGSHPVTKRPRGLIRYLVLVAVALLIVWAFTGCATSNRTVYHADGSKEVIEERKPAIEKDTKQFISDVWWSWSPRPRPARVEQPAATP